MTEEYLRSRSQKERMLIIHRTSEEISFLINIFTFVTLYGCSTLGQLTSVETEGFEDEPAWIYRFNL